MPVRVVRLRGADGGRDRRQPGRHRCAIARALQDAGAEVHITGVEETCAPEDAGRFAYTQLDVTDTGAVRAYAAALPRVDILVNCAAITRRGEEMAPEFFSHVLDVNLTGTFRCAEAMHPALKAAKGAIVNIASMYARFGSPRNPAYGSSKAGVEQLTKSLAIAWAADGIRVNAVAPGLHRDRAIGPRPAGPGFRHGRGGAHAHAPLGPARRHQRARSCSSPRPRRPS
jgi:NAD(P)-dependent dehydrogenase (short-subunit alcohol dehydrogenase family)